MLLQYLSSLLSPSQSLPPNAGRGLTHQRCRMAIPNPQLNEQLPQFVQSVQLPSTRKY